MTKTQKEKILNQSLINFGIAIKDSIVYNQYKPTRVQNIEDEKLANMLKCNTDTSEIDKKFKIASIEPKYRAWSNCNYKFLNETFISYLKAENDYFWAKNNLHKEDLQINIITSDPIGEDNIDDYDIYNIDDIVKFIEKHSTSKNTLYIGFEEYFYNEKKIFKLYKLNEYSPIHNCEYDKYVLDEEYADEVLDCRMDFWDDTVIDFFWQDDIKLLTKWCKEIDPEGIYTIYHRKGKDWYIVPTITEYYEEVCIIPFEEKHILNGGINSNSREFSKLHHFYYKEDDEIKSKLINAIKEQKNGLEFECALASSIFNRDNDNILFSTTIEKLLKYYKTEELHEILRDEIKYNKYSIDEIFSYGYKYIPELIDEAAKKILDRKLYKY